MSDNQPLSDNRLRSINFLCPQLESKLIVDNIRSRLHVDAGGFLTEVEMISVFSGKTRVDHVRALLDVLKTKDNRAFGSFCTILEFEGYGHWSKELKIAAGLECQDITDSCKLDAKVQHRLLQSRKKAFRVVCEELDDPFEEVLESLRNVLLKVFDDNDFLIFALSFDSRLRDVIRNVEFTCEDLAHPNNLMRALAAAKYYSKFKLEALDVMINCLVSKRLTHQKDIKGIMDNYKKNYLKPKMEKTLSDFTSDSEICLALQPNELNLALVCPDSPPFSEVKRAQEYLIDKMGIKKVENLRFDFGCVYILLTITYVSNDLQKLLEEFLHHQKYLMEFGIHRVLLVGYWSLDLCDRTVQTLAPKTENKPWEYKSVSSFKEESVCRVHQSIKDSEEDAENLPATEERPSFQPNSEDFPSVNFRPRCRRGPLGNDGQPTDAAPRIMEQKNMQNSTMTEKEEFLTTDEDLTDLARFLTPQTWMALGRRLLPADDVMTIDADYQAVEEKSYEILYRWRSRNFQSPLTGLLDAARNTGKLGQMCAEIERRIRDRGGQVSRSSTSSLENSIDGNEGNTTPRRTWLGLPMKGINPWEEDEEPDVIRTEPPLLVAPHPPPPPQPQHDQGQEQQQQEELQEPSPHPVVHLRNIFGYKVFVDILPPKTLKVMLVILVIFWILEILGTATTARLLEHVHSSPFECHHKGLIFCLTTGLRALTRCLFPLALTIAFYYVLKERAKGPAIDKLMKELEKKEHCKLLRRVVYIFVDSHLAVQRDNMKVLREMRENLSDDLHAMCITALFSGILLTLPLMELGATNFPHNTYHISGIRFLQIFDTLSHLIRNSFCGLMFAFFFFEIKLKFLISGISKADHLLTGDRELDSKEESTLTPNLKEEAEKTVHSLSLDWCIVEIFLQFASGVYTLLLLMSVASGKPFSCGIYVEPDKFPAETAVHWFWFVILLLFFHIISTSVFIIPLVRPVGVVLEILGVLFLFYSFEETATFTHYLQILYALIPMTYCFWFHLVTIAHEFMFVFYSTERQHPHFKRLAYSTFLLVAMVVTVGASIWNEYNNLSTPGGETKQWWTMSQYGKVLHERSCHSNGYNFKDFCVCESETNFSPCACLSHYISQCNNN